MVSHSSGPDRSPGGMTHVKNLYIRATHRKNDAILSAKKLPQFLFEMPIFWRERVTSREFFQALDGFQ